MQMWMSVSDKKTSEEAKQYLVDHAHLTSEMASYLVSALCQAKKDRGHTQACPDANMQLFAAIIDGLMPNTPEEATELVNAIRFHRQLQQQRGAVTPTISSVAKSWRTN
jgi:hypothetical protein